VIVTAEAAVETMTIVPSMNPPSRNR